MFFQKYAMESQDKGFLLCFNQAWKHSEQLELYCTRSAREDNKNIFLWILCGYCWLDAAAIQQFNEIS